MDTKESFTGGCHCQSVRYTVQGTPMVAGHCHCNNCKSFAGGGHASMCAVSADGFSATGEVTTYTYVGDSGNAIHRHFCPLCSTTAYILNEGAPGMVFLTAGSMDDMEIFKPQMVVYTSRAPSWDLVDASLERFPEMAPIPGG